MQPPWQKASVSAGLTTLTWWLALPPALKEQSPRTLDVLHRWDALQKSAVIAQNSFQMGCNEVWVTKRCSENFDALQLRGQSRTLPRFQRRQQSAGGSDKHVAQLHWHSTL